MPLVDPSVAKLIASVDELTAKVTALALQLARMHAVTMPSDVVPDEDEQVRGLMFALMDADQTLADSAARAMARQAAQPD